MKEIEESILNCNKINEDFYYDTAINIAIEKDRL